MSASLLLPQHDVGLVVLNNMDSSPFGDPYVLDVLLNERFGLNLGVPDKVLAGTDSILDALAQRGRGRQAKAVDFKAVAPFLSYYEDGYRLVREGRDLQLSSPGLHPWVGGVSGRNRPAGGLFGGPPILGTLICPRWTRWWK